MSTTEQEAKSASTATFVTALVFNAIVFGAEIAVFTILRPRFKAVYEPRTYVPIPSKRAQPLSDGLLTWPIALFKADYEGIIKVNGLDAYFFVRFLRMMVHIFLPIWLISWAVLLPVTSVGTSVPGHSGLDLFIFGNVEASKQERYAAHVILAYLFTGWVYYNIRLEMKNFITTRQKHLIDPVHAASVQANTLLVTGIPQKYLSENALWKLFEHLPGGVKKIWINHDLKELPEVYDRRMDACSKLESAEVTLLATATKLHFKGIADAEKVAKKSGETDSPVSEKAPQIEDQNKDVESNSVVATSVVPKDQRPTHRLKPSWAPFGLPFVGPKVDTIEWCREEIRACDELLSKGRKIVMGEMKSDKMKSDNVSIAGSLADEGKKEAGGADGKHEGGDDDMVPKEGAGEYPPMSSAFITFNSQIAAHMGEQVLTHHEPYRMATKYTEVSPEDVIWTNLGMNPYEQKVRMIISYSITAALIIFWAIPVLFIGIISNIHALCKTYSWLAWICKLPPVVVGIISGILPPVLLVVLMMLLPIILRLLAKFEGIPKKTGLELSLMTRYFIFQVIHSFLIVTLASGIISALPGLINSPGQIPTLLAQKLPQASTFFLTYVVLQGLSGTAGGFLQAVPLILYYVKLFILGSTPRSVYGIKYGLRNVTWGTLYPGITLLVVIALGYSIISPIINGLACATFYAFYLLYKYLFLWQFEQPTSGETGGLFFPKAIQHIFVGMYVQQVCLCALFFLARDEKNKPGAIPEGALMVVLIIFTAFFQMLISNSYGPLIHALPLTLADKTYKAPGTQAIEEVPVVEKPSDVEEGSTQGKKVSSKEENVAAHGSGPEGDSIQVMPLSHSSKEKLTAPGAAAQEQHVENRKGQISEEEYGFAHPAASRPQRIVWLPLDPLGLAKEEEKANREAGVDAVVQDAVMNEKGKVDISGPPPDEI